jgi:predicted oxidoreductase
MHPFSQAGPYHCVILGAGAIDTKGGPLTDCDGRVLAGNGRPVPGLFGAGNCVASASGQAYWGPGCSLGLAITFGYLAGRQAAAEPDHVPAIDEREIYARPS